MLVCQYRIGLQLTNPELSLEIRYGGAIPDVLILDGDRRRNWTGTALSTEGF